jgi:uncharacterized protein YukE
MADAPATHRDIERLYTVLDRLDRTLDGVKDTLTRLDERQAAQGQAIADMGKAHQSLQSRVRELEKVNTQAQARLAGVGAGAGGVVAGAFEAVRMWMGW